MARSRCHFLFLWLVDHTELGHCFFFKFGLPSWMVDGVDGEGTDPGSDNGFWPVSNPARQLQKKRLVARLDLTVAESRSDWSIKNATQFIWVKT